MFFELECDICGFVTALEEDLTVGSSRRRRRAEIVDGRRRRAEVLQDEFVLDGPGTPCLTSAIARYPAVFSPAKNTAKDLESYDHNCKGKEI
jgi:hypothetical protein